MRRILITGGSRGIGRATAIACGARGWSVAINYRSDETAAQSAAIAVRAAGGEAVVLRGDSTNETDVVAMFDQASQAMGGLDGVVVNAGVVAPKSLLADMDADRLRHTFAVNIFGAFLATREAARRLSNNRGGQGGSIVLVSSAASRIGSPGEYVDYAASKGAIDSLVRGLSKELAASGVRVNGVRPGVIDTEIHASGGQPGRAERVGEKTPLGRAGKPEEIADAIVWLLGDEASYATGALLDVSGGL